MNFTWSTLRYRLTEGQWARTLRARLRASRSGRLVNQNVRYLYIEIFWAAIFMAAMSFNATFALRLGASNTMIGWMSSFPALFAMVVALPAARFLETQSNRAPWLRRSLWIGRLPFVFVALVPWLFKQHQAEIIVWILILRSIPMNFFSTGFSPLLADIIPAQDRAQVMANRSIVHGATLAVCTFIFGELMDLGAKISWMAFPLNYQVVYLIGAVGAILSTYYAGRLKVPETKVIMRDPPAKVRVPSRAQIKETLNSLLHENRGFVRIVINTLVFNFGAWLVMSLYTIFFVKELNASDGWIGLNTTLANIGVIVGHMIWQRIIRKVGDGKALLLSVIPAAAYAFLVALFPNLTLILLWGILINLVNPGVNLTHFNLLIRLCPEDRRASYMALFSTVMNAGAFIGPMLGVALADGIGIVWVLIIGGILRLLGAVMFFIWRIDKDSPVGAL